MSEKSVTIENTIKSEKGKLFNFIRKNVSSKEDAEDIFQEVLYQLVSGFEELEFIEKISAWLIKVARNKIIDLYRKKKTEPFSDKIILTDENSEEPLTLADILPDLSPLPDEVYWQNLIWEEIEDALEDLNEDQKEVFIMNEFEGLSFKQISEIKKTSINTLLSRKRYAILELRKRLENLYEEIKNVQRT